MGEARSCPLSRAWGGCERADEIGRTAEGVGGCSQGKAWPGPTGPALPWVVLEAGAAAEGEGKAHPGGERLWEAAGPASGGAGLPWPSAASEGATTSQPSPPWGRPRPPVCSCSHLRRYSCCSSALLSSRLARCSLGGRASLTVLLAFQQRREQFPIVKTCVSRG